MLKFPDFSFWASFLEVWLVTWVLNPELSFDLQSSAVHFTQHTEEPKHLEDNSSSGISVVWRWTTQSVTHATADDSQAPPHKDVGSQV